MAHAFQTRYDGTVCCRLEGEEKAVIAQVTQEVADLIRVDLGLDEEPVALQRAADSEDPLERLEAEFAARDARRPSDSAVRKLFPEASPNERLAEEYRRFGQQDLASGKLDDLMRVSSTIDASGPAAGEVVLHTDDALAWLRSLTILRTVVADRLGVHRDGDFETVRMMQQIGERVPESSSEDESEEETVGPDVMIAIYELLSWLQESLVQSLES